MSVIHHLQCVVKFYLKAQEECRFQHNSAIAKHFIGRDLMGKACVLACKSYEQKCESIVSSTILNLQKCRKIKPQSDLLIIRTLNRDVTYYLRKSVMAKNSVVDFALYRDDNLYNAQAFIENVENFSVQIIPWNQQFIKVIINLIFANHRRLEILCWVEKLQEVP